MPEACPESSSGAAAITAVERGETSAAMPSPITVSKREGQGPELAEGQGGGDADEGNPDDGRTGCHRPSRTDTIRERARRAGQDADRERQREKQEARLPFRHIPCGDDCHRQEEEQPVQGDEDEQGVEVRAGEGARGEQAGASPGAMLPAVPTQGKGQKAPRRCLSETHARRAGPPEDPIAVSPRASEPSAAVARTAPTRSSRPRSRRASLGTRLSRMISASTPIR